MDIIIVFSVLVIALVLFISAKVRHDITAIICLLLLIVTGIIPASEAFLGFAHPAVITVAMVLIMSKGLQDSGLVDLIGQWMIKIGNNLILQISVLTIIISILSAFMNNIGALAILMPIAIHAVNKSGHSPSSVLMPLAFASLLGGLMTLIGTPPNIIISAIRSQHLGQPFAMFDFAPVGIIITLTGLIFIIFVSWRLIPKRLSAKSGNDRFHIEDYITEILINKNSTIKGIKLKDFKTTCNVDVQVLSVIRDKTLINFPDKDFVLEENDILNIEVDSNDLVEFLKRSKTSLEHDKRKLLKAGGYENIGIFEAVVTNDSLMLDQTVIELNFRQHYSVNLLAVARKNRQINKQLEKIKFQPGDVLLLQADIHRIDDILKDIGCLPLADRGYSITNKNKIIFALSVFSLAIIAVLSNILPVEIAFTICSLLMILFKIVPLKELYTSVDWPVVVLLGAMLPVGVALETSGAAAMIADQVLVLSNFIPTWLILGILITITMLISGIINNAATVVLMAPIGINIANGVNVSPDPFLMAVAIGASCAFLTPIGHQSNTLVMGPGGYKFGDYWKPGLGLSLIVVLVGLPAILFFWPL